MLSKDERILVEAVRRARSLEIHIPGTHGEESSVLSFKGAGRLLAHDIALAVQSYFSRSSKC